MGRAAGTLVDWKPVVDGDYVHATPSHGDTGTIELPRGYRVIGTCNSCVSFDRERQECVRGAKNGWLTGRENLVQWKGCGLWKARGK